MGDIGSQDTIDITLSGCDAAIYNIGLIREFPRKGVTFEEAHVEGVRRVIEGASRKGVDRFLLMSANGVRGSGTPYQDTKFRAEELLRDSGLKWTIFRPSIQDEGACFRSAGSLTSSNKYPAGRSAEAG